jgi:selenide,water dikinase
MDAPKNILLIGGGHAHIQVLHQLSRLDPQKIRVTLVSDVKLAPYSGMIPSFLAGDYQSEELQFDLESICQRLGFEFLNKAVVKINANQNSAICADAQTLSFDICSINIGIRPQMIPAIGQNSRDVFYLKPISKLIEKWQSLATQFTKDKAELDLTIIGGGAAAFEIAVACRRHFKTLKTKIRIVTGKRPLLSDQNNRVQKLARESLELNSISCIEGQRVKTILDKKLLFEDGSELARQIIFVGVSAQAPEIFRNSNLKVNAGGFVQVNQFLQVLGHENLFAAGDCCEFTPRPLAKAGVFAVREGPILFENIKAKIMNQSQLIEYVPQKHWLSILVSGESKAILCYRNFAIRGRIAWLLKDYIDRRFMRRFQ